MNIRSSSAVALGLVIAAIAATGGMANSGSANSVQCGIVETAQKGMLVLEGMLTSPVAISGEYRLAIRSSSNGGSSNISQGGYFTAKADEATSLGKVTLNTGSSYNVVFDVTANGKKIECDQDITSLR
ncbi:MAG: hypothetical protein JWQ22_2240 [Devosia sp.]|nr:hypothetical protein [Devosia sp.]